MDHCDLIAELPAIEQLPVVKRLELARKRRAYQLTKCKESEKKENGPLRPRKRLLKFQPTIALLEAASRGDVDEVRELLEAGVDPDSRNEDGLTPLHQCCIDNSEEVLLLLLAYGANVNARDTELWSPLHAAACCGHMNICKHLVNHGADLLAVNADSNMAYDICDDDLTLDFLESEMAIRGVTQEQIDALRANNERQMLLDLQRLQRDGATLEFIDTQGATPLHIASANGYGSVAQFLLDCGVSVDPRDNDSWQPVHAAACWAQPLLLEMLVAYGADITAQTDGGETALDLCEEPEVRDIIVDLCRRQKEQKLRFSRDSHRLSKRKKPSSKFESPQYASTTSSFESHSSSSRAIRRLSLRDKSGATLARLEARQEALLRSRSLDDDSSLINDSNVPNQIHDAGGDYDISMETDSERDENDDEVDAGFRRGANSQPRAHRNDQQDGPIVVRHPGRGQKQLLHDPSLDYAVAPGDDATLQRPCSEPPNFASAISAADWIKRLKQEELALPPATNGKSSSHVTSPALANSSPASSRGGCHSNASSPLATGKASVSSNDTATKTPLYRGTPNTTRPTTHARNLNLTTTVSTDSCDEDEPACGTSIAGVQVLLVEQKPSPILPSKNAKTPQAVVSNNEETSTSASNNRNNVNNISITPSNSFAVSPKSVDQPLASVAQNSSSTEVQVKNAPGASSQSGPEGTPPVAKSVPVYRIAGSARNTGSVQPPTEFVPESNSRRPSADQKAPAQTTRSSANKLPLQRSLDSPVKTPSTQPDPSHQQSHPSSSSSAADAGHSYRLGTTLPPSATVQQSSGSKPSGKNHHPKATSGPSSHQHHHKEQNSVGAATSARNHNARASDKVVTNPTFVVGSSRLELTGRERGIDVGDFEAAGDTGRFSSPVARFRAPEGEVVGGAHRRSSKIHDGGKCCAIL